MVAYVEHINRSIELDWFYPDPKTRLERHFYSLCPCPALLFYHAETQHIRKDNQLFVSYQAGRQGKAVTRATISRWIKNMICYSYRKMGRSLPISSVRAHSTRTVASTLADIQGVSPADLCQAATWSSVCTFSRHYRRDMIASTGISTQVLSAGVAGGRR